MGDHPLRCTPPPPDEDYLSNLPDSLLLHILSFLSTHDYVRTSVLARRWRSLWASVPSISFDDDDFHPEVGWGADEIIHEFITSRRNSCAVFSYRIAVDDICLVPLIDYAKSHGAQEVTLSLYNSPMVMPLFSTLFDWPSLSALDVRLDFVCYWPRIHIPPKSIVLSNLKRLYLTVGVFQVQSVIRLLACCSKLEELTLDASVSTDAAIEIKIPNLRKLSLTNTLCKTQITCPKLECLSVGSCYNLKEFHSYTPSLVSINFGQFRLCHTLASRLCNVTELSTSLQILPFQMMELQSMIESFSLFTKLKKLKIHLRLFHKYSMPLLFGLLMRTPNLYSLVVIDDEEVPSLLEFCSWRKSSIVKNIEAYKSFDNLKIVSVKIKSFRIRSTFLKILSERVRAWDEVVVKIF